ncbi:phosphoenolpyruvate carboxylase [Marinibactrum halimedae]|uniref:Phosphoenolpyruvate carboxylase n=1 Tax=Marinibactrum halimedae TaxID=1444977 RepID=A0AA37T4Q9_9GAMM|nr:phosphoenolpyruvate carboxylase [Marinibactrum halimedae]MCD9459693.1 phosphoenolpyruvate carboxylase [Marinibactrum halimedae]GLS25719.1 phosphoenolpyruvate carboxylase [Marinibactrum halimedae]
MNEQAVISEQDQLKENIRLLGRVLGQTISSAHGDEVLEQVEAIRKIAHDSSNNDEKARSELTSLLSSLSNEQMLIVARAFNQFLNLANIAEQYQSIAPGQENTHSGERVLVEFIRRSKDSVSAKDLQKALEELSIELVFTAHPTEVSRRTLIQKHQLLNDCLEALDKSTEVEQQDDIHGRIAELIAQAWHSDEIREQRPTPVDEAKWGFGVIEQSLWFAVPKFMRRIHKFLNDETDITMPTDWMPMSFVSWMGGDRDGNPFVTHKVSDEVLASSRWMAMDLYLHDVEQLCAEISVVVCNDTLRARVGDATEPYRVLLRQLRDDIHETRSYLSAKLTGESTDAKDVIQHTEQLREPLQLCYDSLVDSGLELIANGLLRDTLWRVHAFGAPLVKLDIRQDSERHTEVLSELTRYLGIGDYEQWSESDKQNFLLSELASKRPLIPADWQPSDNVQEVLNTFRLIAKTDPNALGIYIISMARQASDVLAVQLLLSECGCTYRMPVAPLFETLDDLNRSEHVIRKLLENDAYRGYLHGKQYIMIGYSDSAKDAGFFAAGWAQYRAQEALVNVAKEYDLQLILFHGRGGTVGRGGAPAHQALLSQPPGSLQGGLRVTEQGEMIRFKYGLTDLAVQSISRFAAAVLEGNLLPPPEPKQEWRDIMDQLSDTSCEVYRGMVRENPEFVPYFRAATPELELGKLPLGSRPTKRKPGGGVETLRAIPWIFAWSQNRMLLPAWLGTGEALEKVRQDGGEQELITMFEQWPFFNTRLSMLEMVFTKTDPWLARLYDEKLVPKDQRHLGEDLRSKLENSVQQVLDLIPTHSLMDADPQIHASINIRNPYIDPLNILQVELLLRSREQGEQSKETVLEKALMVTIAGVAAGLRNTG